MIQRGDLGAFHFKRTADGPMVLHYHPECEEIGEPEVLPGTNYEWGTEYEWKSATIGSYNLARDILEIVGGAEGREAEFVDAIISRITLMPLTYEKIINWRDGPKCTDENPFL